MKHIVKSTWVKVLAVLLLVVVAFFIRNALEQKDVQQTKQVSGTKRAVDYAESVGKEHPTLGVFYEQYPDAKVLLACEEDVTNDGNKDLVVICKLGEHVRTTVLIDRGDHMTYHSSTPIPAPVENQKIQFKNIDKEGEVEIVITGEKKGAVGYAIYRMVDGEPMDLFGEGMEDCC